MMKPTDDDITDLLIEPKTELEVVSTQPAVCEIA